MCVCVSGEDSRLPVPAAAPTRHWNGGSGRTPAASSHVRDVDAGAEDLLQLLLVVLHLPLHHVHAGPEQALERVPVQKGQSHGAHRVGRSGARVLGDERQLAQVAALLDDGDLPTDGAASVRRTGRRQHGGRGTP